MAPHEHPGCDMSWSRGGSVLVGLMLASLLEGPAVAANDANRCSGPLTQQGCWETTDGKVVVGLGDQAHSTSRQSDDARSSRRRTNFSAQQMAVAFCVDASADAAASGGTSPEI